MPATPLSTAALAILAVLESVMMAALLTRTPPHPPLEVAPFALMPFLAASIAMTVAAIILGASSTRDGRLATFAAVALALGSFGPQKWIDPNIGRIWPAVVLAELAMLVLAVELVRPQAKSRQP